jgi:alkanesulfonate monooxygenase SsuD/methylene tetrahydromethanopterin reductase-like flavin-dependent oxidoreductase (luciferase family)
MRVGLHALGIGDGARPEVIRTVATAAEAHGFARLWCGEHVVLVDTPASRYPYSADGRIAVPAGADWLDPLLALSFAAAVTNRIELATGVLLLPDTTRSWSPNRPPHSMYCPPDASASV